jgi:hypothetical protein
MSQNKSLFFPLILLCTCHSDENFDIDRIIAFCWVQKVLPRGSPDASTSEQETLLCFPHFRVAAHGRMTLLQRCTGDTAVNGDLRDMTGYTKTEGGFTGIIQTKVA